MSIDNMAKTVKELKTKGLTTREIAQEIHLSRNTVEWLLAKQASENFDRQMPADVKVGWRTIGVSGSRIHAIAEIMSDVVLEEQEKQDVDFNMVTGLTNNGVPLAVIVSDLLGVDFGMIRPSREDTETNYASNYAGLENKNIVIIDDVISTGSTTAEAIDYIRSKNGRPALIVVLINKKAEDELSGVALRSLIRARPVRD